MSHPRGFLESLKRSFDKELSRAGIRLPYWFCIDRDWDGRLHIHGAFSAVTENEVLKGGMRRAWGEAPAARPAIPDQDRSAHDDGWATYATRNLRRVSAKIGPTFTMTRPLQQDAQWTYSEMRRIMRETYWPTKP
ncbi:hypothetical protein [Bradyrhizobium sp. LB13.1]